MSFLVWCSFLVISVVGWNILIGALSGFRLGFETRWLAANNVGFGKSIFRLLVLAMMQPSWGSWLADMMALRATNALPRRSFLAGLSLLRLTSLFGLVIVGGLLMNINSYFVLIAGAALWAIAKWWRPLGPWSLILIGLGLVLCGFEMSLRQSSILFSSAMELPFLFALGDSLWTTVFGAFAVASLVAFITQVPGFGFLVSAILVFAGLASLASALALALGDIFGLWIFFLWVYRKSRLRQENSIRFLIFVGVTIICFAGFPLVLEVLQSAIPGGYSPELRFLQFVLLLVLVFSLETILSLGFFHFYNLKKVPAIAKGPVSIPPEQELLLSPACKEVIRRRIIQTLV